MNETISPLLTTQPATEAQTNFLIKLLAEKIEDPAESLAAIKWVNEHRMSKATASAKITEYMAKPSVRKAFSTATDLEEGIYQCEDDIFKVYRTRQGHLATKRWTDEISFEYTGQQPLRRLKPEHRMSLEEAQRFGQITGTCGHCGRTLTDEDSIAAGIGPICAGKYS